MQWVSDKQKWLVGGEGGGGGCSGMLEAACHPGRFTFLQGFDEQQRQQAGSLTLFLCI